MQEFKLPDLGEGMQEAEIRRWLVKPGDTVKLDQPMVEVETDKAVVEIPSPVLGRIADICVPEGSVAKLGQVLVLFEGGASLSAKPGVPASIPGVPVPIVGVPTRGTPTMDGAMDRVPTRGTPTMDSAINQAPTPFAKSRTRVQAAPAVRKLAFELSVDLEQITPSHQNGRVSLEDVRAYAERQNVGTQLPTPQMADVGAQFIAPPLPSSPTGGEERQRLTGLRKRIAEHMERSWRTVPHATCFAEVDGSELIALRSLLKPLAEQRNVRLTYMPLLVKLLLPVLKEFPIFNASLDEERREIVYKRFYHIGIAADSPEGLLVPVLRNADQLTVLELASKLEHLVEGARKRTLTLPELSGSTFTLNNVGSFGIGRGTPIINYPEVAILAVGRLQEQAIVRQGSIIVRPMLPLTLSFDHRLIDGAMAAKFCTRFQELVETPQQLILDMQ